MTRNHRLFKAVPIPTHVRRLAGSHYVKIDSSNSVGVIIRFGRLSFFLLLFDWTRLLSPFW